MKKGILLSIVGLFMVAAAGCTDPGEGGAPPVDAAPPASPAPAQ